MPLPLRSKRVRQLEVDGKLYEVELLEIPFREGVEFCCRAFEPPIRLSDQGLGESEGLRLLTLEIQRQSKERGDL